MNNQIIKISLAIILLLCLFKMPYGYYEFVRFASMIGFAYLANSAYQKKINNEVFIFLSLAILFQPFEKFAFGRIIWNVIDIVIALFLLLSLLKTNDKN